VFSSPTKGMPLNAIDYERFAPPRRCERRLCSAMVDPPRATGRG
jgi:hypothetical protein